MNIVVLKKEVDPQEVISTLEDLLERAKKGEFESFVAICFRPDKSFCTRSTGYKNGLEMLGVLACASNDLIKAMER